MVKNNVHLILTCLATHSYLAQNKGTEELQNFTSRRTLAHGFDGRGGSIDGASTMVLEGGGSKSTVEDRGGGGSVSHTAP
jgi:hypothetical protein